MESKDLFSRLHPGGSSRRSRVRESACSRGIAALGCVRLVGRIFWRGLAQRVQGFSRSPSVTRRLVPPPSRREALIWLAFGWLGLLFWLSHTDSAGGGYYNANCLHSLSFNRTPYSMAIYRCGKADKGRENGVVFLYKAFKAVGTLYGFVSRRPEKENIPYLQ